jgi:hypothetical protein
MNNLLKSVARLRVGPVLAWAEVLQKQGTFLRVVSHGHGDHGQGHRGIHTTVARLGAKDEDIEAKLRLFEEKVEKQIQDFSKTTLSMVQDFRKQLTGSKSATSSPIVRMLTVEEVEEYQRDSSNKYKVAFDLGEYRTKDLRVYMVGNKIIIDRHKQVEGKGNLKTVKAEVLPEEVDPYEVIVLYDKTNKFLIIEAPLPQDVDADKVREKLEAKLKEKEKEAKEKMEKKEQEKREIKERQDKEKEEKEKKEKEKEKKEDK